MWQWKRAFKSAALRSPSSTIALRDRFYQLADEHGLEEEVDEALDEVESEDEHTSQTQQNQGPVSRYHSKRVAKFLSSMSALQIKNYAHKCVLGEDTKPSKRKMVSSDDSPQKTKRVKTVEQMSEQIDSELPSFLSSQKERHFLTWLHRAVLREGAAAGIIDPLLVNVGEHGVVGFTSEGIERIKAVSQYGGISKYKTEKHKELCEELQDKLARVLKELGFDRAGPKVLYLSLQECLRQRGLSNPANTILTITRVLRVTKPQRDDLRKKVDNFSTLAEQSKWEPFAIESLAPWSNLQRLMDNENMVRAISQMNIEGVFRDILDKYEKLSELRQEMLDRATKGASASLMKMPDCPGHKKTSVDAPLVGDSPEYPIMADDQGGHDSETSGDKI
ncbi:hypothetical protein M406DRAFT_75286 [Cryphonectria parasitica EP155]|uniref:Uncharacterized protein n=1 Tax=Cryphonectria parasitica (strain ATCC 38755 / EP155) TaxID=660469 RepID=A0A9P5CGY0_CRYP1|nr:uncharacterized protein M406DRAFT_75286 [Cryphonectria parasitica EP155]KAF3759904.1 hypothetical protein M406DRAFT_75286 [Cryphonectria parasitica EP155]